jgi:hypothetical protein
MRAYATVGPRAWNAAEAYLDFRARLREMLALGDAGEFRAFLRQEGHAQSDYDLVLMSREPDPDFSVLMHRLILADAELAEHHVASRVWLRRHGFGVPPASRGYGQPNARRVELARTA